MANIGMFEPAPLVAVGVSGGADSMALMLMTDAWARLKGGKAVGLTVDHGLRKESGPEAEWVARELARRGIEHHTILWQGPKPTTGIQDKARRARRQLMLDWCRDQGVLHLCLGHHANDQVETHLMRIAHRSNNGDEQGGVRDNQFLGLASMSVIREYAQARIIRPLLSIEKERLEAALQSMNQPWLNDPSNEDLKFERVRIRKAVSALDEVGKGVAAMADAIRQYGEARYDLEQLGTRALASSVALFPAGFARLDLRNLNINGDVAAKYALSRLLMVIGGRRYPVAREKLDQAYKALRARNFDSRLTIGGCLVSRTDDGVLVTREERNLPERQTVTGHLNIHWDNRFKLSLSRPDEDRREELVLGKLGRRGYDQLVRKTPDLKHHPVPMPARFSLPALFYNDEIISVSHLTNRYTKFHPRCDGFEKTAFSPPEPVLGGMFSVALAGFCTISDTMDSPQEVDERKDA